MPPPLPGEMRRSPGSGKSSRRRQSQRSRDRMFLTLAFVLGGIIVLGMLIFIALFMTSPVHETGAAGMKAYFAHA
jgi:hypothetical protein